MKTSLLVFTTLALVEIETSAVGGETGVFDERFGLLDGREPVVLKHVLFDDDAVDVIGASVQPEFTERKSHAKQRNFNVWDVVEVQAAEREQLEVFVAAHMADGELVGLRLERPDDKALESARDVLRFAHVFQMFYDFFGGFCTANDDVRAAGEAFLVAGGKCVAPLLRGELLGAQNLTHAVRENLGACAWNGTEACILENVKQFVERYPVEFRDADKFNRRESAHLNAQFLREHLENVSVIVERNFLVDATLQKNLVGTLCLGFESLLADFV